MRRARGVAVAVRLICDGPTPLLRGPRGNGLKSLSAGEEGQRRIGETVWYCDWSLLASGACTGLQTPVVRHTKTRRMRQVSAFHVARANRSARRSQQRSRSVIGRSRRSHGRVPAAPAAISRSTTVRAEDTTPAQSAPAVL